MKKSIKSFIITSPLLRKLRNTYQQKIFPIILKILLAIFILLIGVFVFLKIFKPEYITKAYNRVYVYFQRHIHFDDYAFENINVTGNKRVNQEEIIAIIRDVSSNIKLSEDENYQPLIQKLVNELKKKLPWISHIVITRNMPNDLNVVVSEYEPFAIWQNAGAKYVTDKDGNLVKIQDLEEFSGLVILSGEGANHHARSLFNIFTTDLNLSQHIYSATWIGGRRWDVRLDNGLLIKLPESNISEAWQSLIKIYNLPGSVNGLKAIDLRIPRRVYLEYDDSSIKKLKTI